MDIWDPYVASVREHLRQGSQKTVCDKFHIAKHLGDAVDKVRRQENRTLRAAGDSDRREHATTGCGIRPPWNRPIAKPLPRYVRVG
jgi:transposase